MKEFAGKQSVRFSDNHGRILARSRYVSESYDKADTTAPEITFKITQPPQVGDKQIQVSLEAKDAGGLAGALVYDTAQDSVVAGLELKQNWSGYRFVLRHRALVAGETLHYRIVVSDINGNVGLTEVTYKVPSKPDAVQIIK